MHAATEVPVGVQTLHLRKENRGMGGKKNISEGVKDTLHDMCMHRHIMAHFSRARNPVELLRETFDFSTPTLRLQKAYAI